MQHHCNFPLDYIVRFRITTDGRLHVRTLNRYEDTPFGDDDDESEDLAASADDNREIIIRAPKDDSSQALVNIIDNEDKDESTDTPFDDDDDESEDLASSEEDNREKIIRAPKDDLSQALVNIMDDEDKDEYTILRILKGRLKKNKAIRIDSCSSEDKCTALHKAAKKGYTKLVEWLLKKHASPYSKNKFQQTPLEVAIQEKYDEIAEVLVKKMSRESVISLFWIKRRRSKQQHRSLKNIGDNKEIKLSIKSLLIDDLQKTTLAVLDHFTDNYHCVYLTGPLEMDDAKKIPNDENYNVKDLTAYQMIARKDLKLFACHDCVKALTASKWRAYGNGILWRTALVYFVFLVLLSFAAVTGVSADDVTKCNETIDVFRVISELLVCFYALLTVIGECVQIVIHKTEYLKDIFNYMELGSSLLILCVIPLRFSNRNEQWHVFAFGYILWTLRIFKIATMNQFIGHLGHIILHLFIYDVWKFVVYFLIILLSFSGGLLLSLKGDDDLAVHNDTSDFKGILFVGVRVLIEGQPFLEYTGPDGYSTVSCIVMLAFLAFTCVVMLNIFIAQLSNRFNDIQQNEKSYFHNSVARTMAKLELKDDLTIFRFGEPLWKKYYKDEIKTAEFNTESWVTTTINGFRSGVGVNLCKGKCPCSRVSS